MDILDGHTLEDALRFCDNRPGVRVGIACADEQSAHTLVEALWSEITNGRMNGWQMGRCIDNFYDEAKIMRGSGAEVSFIEIFNASRLSAIRGRSYHRVLCDVNLHSKYICELYPIEYLSCQCEKEVGGEELDEFLKSFKII